MSTLSEIKHRNALDMAANRAKVMKEWLEAGNKLNFQTQPEFRKLMKQADKLFKQQSKL